MNVEDPVKNRRRVKRYCQSLIENLVIETGDDHEYRVLHYVWSNEHERCSYWSCINYLAAHSGAATRDKIPERRLLMACIQKLFREGLLSAGWRKHGDGLKSISLSIAGEKRLRKLSGTSEIPRIAPK